MPRSRYYVESLWYADRRAKGLPAEGVTPPDDLGFQMADDDDLIAVEDAKHRAANLSRLPEPEPADVVAQRVRRLRAQ